MPRTSTTCSILLKTWASEMRSDFSWYWTLVWCLSWGRGGGKAGKVSASSSSKVNSPPDSGPNLEDGLREVPAEELSHLLHVQAGLGPDGDHVAIPEPVQNKGGRGKRGRLQELLSWPDGSGREVKTAV